MDSHRYERLNNYVMGVIYSPLLAITAFIEAREAQTVRLNRKRGEEDDDTTEEWEEMQGAIDFEGDGWGKKVEVSRPNVEVDAAVVEVRGLQKEVKELKEMIRGMSAEPDGSGS
jgi:hypothetical protein